MENRNIDRTDLDSQHHSEPNSPPDSTLESYFRQRLEQLYAAPPENSDTNNENAVKNDPADVSEQGQCEKKEEEEEKDKDEYEFRLFANPAALVSQRIALRSPSPARLGDLGLAGKGRPDGYYFTGPTSTELKAQYARVAVEGGDIVAGARMRWRGMELPWRVTILKNVELPGQKVVLGALEQQHGEQQLQMQKSGRKRSGKKRRIVIRRRAEKRAEEEVLARRGKIEREEAERENRTRRNREKKVKRKRKDKERKMGAGEEEG